MADDAPGPSFTLEMRSFIPFATVARFSGDNRGFSIDRDASSRIHYSVVLRPDTAKFDNSMSWPGESHGPLQFVGPKSKAYSSDTKATITGKKVDHGANYKIHVSGSDPLIIGAPDADVHADVTITRHLSGLVKIEVSVRGDQFPAYEMVIRDRKNNSIFLSGFMPVSGGDATKLIGDSQELLGKLTITATLDKNGNFDRILSANFKGPYAEIGNDRDPNSSFTLTGWSRALMTVLTPDNMPEPKHLPEPAQKPHQSKSPDIARSKGGMER